MPSHNATLVFNAFCPAPSGVQRSGRDCPFCGGRKSFSFVYGADSRLSWLCHRASCAESGSEFFIDVRNDVQRSTDAEPLRTGTPRASAAHLRTFDVSLHTEATLLQQFGLAPSTVRKYVKDLDYPEYRIALPIYAPDGAARGVVNRAVRGYACTGPKALTYLFDENALGISWYSADAALPVVVVVEDQLSAIKGVQEVPGFKWVALLGTTLSEDRIAELQNKNLELVIALDADATSTAFDHARKWGQAFDRCRVVVLQKDVKDMTSEEIREKFN